jgi:FkbM family methyltransferase
LGRRLKLWLLALSRKLHFRGKARLLDLVGLGPSHRDVVPEGIDSVRCIEGIVVHTSRPTDIMFRELFVNGLYQSDVLVALRNLLRPGGVFWDIGANYGLMSLYVDRHFRGAVRSVAFEPSPMVLTELRRNVEANDCRSVQIEPICLSDRPGTVTFYTSPDNSWNATLIKQFAESSREADSIEVEASTLDECVKRLPPPDVIKLDVEGAEPLVIAGGETFLRGASAAIVAEYNELAIRDFGWTPERYLDLYRDLGYRIQRIPRRSVGLHRWSDLIGVRGPDELPGLCNLVLTK